jgi:hypothetical protein
LTVVVPVTGTRLTDTLPEDSSVAACATLGSSIAMATNPLTVLFIVRSVLGPLNTSNRPVNNFFKHLRLHVNS